MTGGDQGLTGEPDRKQKWLALIATPLVLCVLVAGVSFIGTLAAASIERSALAMLVNLLIVIALYVFAGNSGVLSFGHLIFVIFGAYTGAILVLDPAMKELLFPDMLQAFQAAHLPTVPAIIAGGLAAVVLALVLSPALMRLAGLNAALATFVVLIIINVVASNWKGGTNAAQGMSNLPSIGFTAVLATALLSIVVAWAFQQTSICKRIRATREDDVAARAVGIKIAHARTVAFVFSAFIAGVAGALYGQVQGSIQPDAFFLRLTFVTIAMLVIGGMRSLSGAVVGVLVISVLSEIFVQFERGVSIGPLEVTAPVGLWQVALSLAMLYALHRRPDGLTGGREITWPLLRARRHGGSGGDPPGSTAAAVED